MIGLEFDFLKDSERLSVRVYDSMNNTEIVVCDFYYLDRYKTSNEHRDQDNFDS